MDITAGLAAVSSALTVVRELRSIDAQYDVAEFKLKVAELAGALADAKLALLEAQTNLAQAEAEIKRVREAFAFRGELISVKGYRYEAVDGEPVNYPYCPRCDGVDGRLVRLTRNGGWNEGQCPQCKSHYQGVTPYNYPDKAR